METKYVLTDNVNVRRPVLAELLTLLFIRLIRIKSDGGNIVCKCVKPYVRYVAGIEIHGDSPAERGSGNAEILQAALNLKEVIYHFFLSGFRLNELRVCLNVSHKLVSILAHLEEVSLFLCSLYSSATVGAFAAFCLSFSEKGLTGCAIPTLVFALINIALIVELLEYFLYCRLVIVVSCTDKVVVFNVHLVPKLADLNRNAVNVCLRCNSCVLCKVLDLLTVLVSSRTIENVKAHLLFIARHSVSHNCLVCVTKVRLLRCVRYRCCYIIFLAHFKILSFEQFSINSHYIITNILLFYKGF